MVQIAICDDNSKDIQYLKQFLGEILDKYSIRYHIKEYTSGEELLKEPLIFQLIFLDIIMENGKNGMEIGKQIYRRNRTVRIIFQTNFGQYCQEALNKSHAFAFLEKPLQKSALEEQLREFIEENNQEQLRIEFRNAECLIKGKEEQKAILNLPVQGIIYFEYLKMQKKIKIVTDKGNYVYAETISRLEERVKPLGFAVCCRGILVNLERVKKIKGYQVLLDDNRTLPLSQRRVAEFKERINEYIHGSY